MDRTDPFTGDVVVKATVAGKRWELRQEFCYNNPEHLEHGGKTDRITVAAHLDTDFASVPRAFVWLFPRYGVYTRSAILHDSLCTDESVQRAEADRIFRVSMRELDVAVVRRWVMWAGVRAGGMWKVVRAGGMWRAVRSPAVLKRVAGWLLVAVPAAVFLAVPAVVISVWLVLFWLIEKFLYLLLKAFRKEPNHPKLLFKTS
ncbi:DUF1353 domain-containing protein [Streptomyces sp. TLI_185]|uniref:DUF1353 domain-containing protein n=1 Tax=Streptomyces sp. TLI_185 TaxID=2485151 RepID=UPI000F50590F|nr:DUF1353 domain-containing protein [Streptomyces sp. TLI_185]RPF30970.1 uncharacterized protein DUF1353 [Streptomyces sp. TLI_185]